MTDLAHTPTLSAVIPVRGMGALLEGCLQRLASQERHLDEVILVDDTPGGSTSLPRDEKYRVVASGGVGPYAARNIGWKAAVGDVVLFLDARSRPLPEWAGRLADLVAAPGVGMAGCDVRVVGGASWAARAAVLEQPFAVSSYVDRAWFRPYLPTCSLAVRRGVLEATEGFAATRSGGDADLCWRAQELGWRLVVDPDVLMNWVPRDDYRDYLEQHYRYGRSNTLLREEWRARGASPAVVPSTRQVALMAGTALARGVYGFVRGRGDRVEFALLESARVATRLGVRRAARELAKKDSPGA